ncbi:MAG: terminase gpA endonuclease subunit [Alistipes sp.]
MLDIDRVGADWIVEQVNGLTERIEHVSPSDYNEANRYLPESVTSMPGYIRYAVNPYMREIVDCFDVDSPVREVNLKKGVQITYSTVLESGTLYYMGHVKTLPIMYMTADKELASARIENNFIPMLQQSGLEHIIRSSDEGNSRKTGKTKNHIQFEGGGYLVPFGAINANKMRSFSIAVLLKDEIDAWPDKVGKDGDPDKLSDDRCSAYWERRKILRGSTPLIKGTSKIEKAYLRGDQRKYMVLCKKCKFPQELRWSTEDNVGGFKWDLDDGGTLILESVRYCCQNCGEAHFEHDKDRLFSEKNGAHWKPTAKPVEPGIRSYHLPALYSPFGMQPWYKCVLAYLDAFDPVERKVKDIHAYQVFYNNVLAEPFEIMGAKIRFESVSLHRRMIYKQGDIPNNFALRYAGSPILFLTCQVDVHKSFLAVSVMGWAKDARCFVIEYKRLDGEDCSDLSDPVWSELRKIIEETTYTADDGKIYKVLLTLIDAGYAHDTTVTFCSDYGSNVYPILGRDRPSKSNNIIEFAQFETRLGTIGYRITVDHYKDRIAPVLRREWVEDSGEQDAYHFNAPYDLTDAQLKELTVETRREQTDSSGITSYKWHRPGNARNELWDLLCYGHAAVEILAWSICIEQFELKTIDWPVFWEFIEHEQKYFIDADEIIE